MAVWTARTRIYVRSFSRRKVQLEIVRRCAPTKKAPMRCRTCHPPNQKPRHPTIARVAPPLAITAKTCDHQSTMLCDRHLMQTGGLNFYLPRGRPP
jgi:hypothetical protein